MNERRKQEHFRGLFFFFYFDLWRFRFFFMGGVVAFDFRCLYLVSDGLVKKNLPSMYSLSPLYPFSHLCSHIHYLTLPYQSPPSPLSLHRGRHGWIDGCHVISCQLCILTTYRYNDHKLSQSRVLAIENARLIMIVFIRFYISLLQLPLSS